MNGIDINNLDTIIKKNNLYLSSFNNNSRRLVSAINDLNECYSGSSLEYLFKEPINEIKNIQTISNIIENYSNVLYGVKVSYQRQDQNLKDNASRIISNL